MINIKQNHIFNQEHNCCSITSNAMGISFLLNKIINPNEFVEYIPIYSNKIYNYKHYNINNNVKYTSYILINIIYNMIQYLKINNNYERKKSEIQKYGLDIIENYICLSKYVKTNKINISVELYICLKNNNHNNGIENKKIKFINNIDEFKEVISTILNISKCNL